MQKLSSKELFLYLLAIGTTTLILFPVQTARADGTVAIAGPFQCTVAIQQTCEGCLYCGGTAQDCSVECGDSSPTP